MLCFRHFASFTAEISLEFSLVSSEYSFFCASMRVGAFYK